MSIWDNVKKIAQPYADDEYDDYDDDDDYVDDYEEPEEPVRRSSRRAPAASAPVEEEDEDSFGFAPAAPAVSASAAPSHDFSGKVLRTSSSFKQAVVLFRPTSYAETNKVADELKQQKAVIVNMEGVESTLSRRVVDFLSGCVYAMDGKVTKVAKSAYIFCPNNMEVEGNLDALQPEIESYI